MNAGENLHHKHGRPLSVARVQEVGVLRYMPSPTKWVVESLITGKEVEVSPSALNPGFALTFHRCQSQTFDFPLYIDTKRIFDRSMLYVAVSRVRSRKSLVLVGNEADWSVYVRALPPRLREELLREERAILADASAEEKEAEPLTPTALPADTGPTAVLVVPARTPVVVAAGGAGGAPPPNAYLAGL